MRDLDAYVAGNTEGDLVWRDQRLSEVDVVVVGDTAVLTAASTTSSSGRASRARTRMRLTLTWVREDGVWRVLAGHAG